MKFKLIVSVLVFMSFGCITNCLFAQTFNIGVSSDMGYEFYRNELRDSEDLMDTSNPTVGVGINAEIIGRNVLYSIGWRINRSQRIYNYVYESIDNFGFRHSRFNSVNKIIDASNLVVCVGLKKRRLKFLIGAQASKTLRVKNNGSQTIKINRNIISQETNDPALIEMSEASSIDLVLEMKYMIFEDADLSLRFAFDSKSESYSSNNPLGRITIGVQMFILQRKYTN